ncbi:non-specific lipid-transfer protein 2-like [Olea europaea var. sylvestris]|uniref:non-specific lipid-transfer protein 2-like n=1 Tax=Olea europaea var. sylvestris TaxID=158386 RepID=UPI000C1D2BA6|nr:non-specific lipid-transfer protein 2-like [Olea europaea var. sylvestris]
MKTAMSFALCLAVVVLFVGKLQVTEAVNCSPLELSSCAGAIMMSLPPSDTCCRKLKEQEPCLCGYIRNPSLSQYVNSPNARRVANICGVPTPRC